MSELFGGKTDYPFAWDVYTSPVMDDIGEEPDFHKIKRNDTNETLHIATKRYNPISNKQFMETVDSLVKHFDCKIEKAGSFKNGKEIFVQMTNNDFVDTLIPGDKNGQVKGFVTLANSHNGGLAFRLFAGLIRIWCTNTWTVANRYADVALSVKHTINARDRVTAFVHNIENIAKMQHMVIQQIKDRTEMKFRGVEEFAEELYRLEYKPRPYTRINKNGITEKLWTGPELSTRGENLIENFVKVYDKYDDIEHGNWRLFNAVTDVVDHGASENRISNGYTMFGGGNNLKLRAFDLIYG